MTGWNLRYGSHLSYRQPDDPLFPFSARGIEPLAQAEYAASIGFAGVLYAYAVTAPDCEIDQVASACARLNLEVGTTLFAPHVTMREPLWGRRDAAAQETIDARLERALGVAARLSCGHVAVVAAAAHDEPLPPQRAAMVENLKRVADRAGDAGVALEIEPMSRKRLPGMILHGMDETLSLLEAVAHPAVRLIFDTGHVYDNEDDVIGWLKESWNRLGIVQIADQPMRVEPGLGVIDIEAVLCELMRRNYRGLVEMEHGWAEPGLQSEQEGLARLAEMDRRAHAKAQCDRRQPSQNA